VTIVNISSSTAHQGVAFRIVIFDLSTTPTPTEQLLEQPAALEKTIVICIMDALPVSNKTAGVAESAQNSILETGAGLTQVSP
jgi:hypothetical protein